MPQFDISTSAGYPVGSAPITASSGNQANANAVATLANVAGKTTYISGLILSSNGATAAVAVNPTIAGVVTGTMTLTYAAVAGAAAADQTVVISFNPPIPASAANTAIVVTLPALGAGNTNATASAWGFQL